MGGSHLTPGCASGRIWPAPQDSMLLRGWVKSHDLCTAVLFLFTALIAPSLAGPVRFSNGLQANTRSQSESVSGVAFYVTEEGTTALCDLSFAVDLSSIQSAQVSCSTLYDLTGSQVNISETSHDWTFYASVGGDVYELDASLTFDPTLETVSSLTLCFSPTCSLGSSSSGALDFCLNYPESSSSSSSSSSSKSSSSSSYSSSSSNSAFVLTFGSSSSLSSSSSELECLCEEPSSSSSSSSNAFVLTFDSSPSSSSSSSSSLGSSTSSSSSSSMSSSSSSSSSSCSSSSASSSSCSSSSS